MRHPILEKILEADVYVRLYALNGMALSYANEIEDSLFFIYWQSSGKPWEDAAAEFYRHVRFAHKQDTVDAAVKAHISPNAASAWFDLIRRTQDLLGNGSLRNLIGHNAVSTGIFQNNVREGRGIKLDMAIRQYVTQKREMTETGKRARVSATDDELTDYCEALTGLLLDLEAFLVGPLQLDPKHPERYSRTYWS